MNSLRQYDPMYDVFFNGYRSKGLNLYRLRRLISAYDIMKGTCRKLLPGIGRSKDMNTLVNFVSDLAEHTEKYDLSDQDDLNFCFSSWLASILGDRAKALESTEDSYSLMLVGAFTTARPDVRYSLLNYMSSKNLTSLIYMIVGLEFIHHYAYSYIIDLPTIKSKQAYLDVEAMVKMYAQHHSTQ